jgi:Flp pilus assembly protein TadD
MTQKNSFRLVGAAIAIALSLAAMPGLAVDTGGEGNGGDGPSLSDARVHIRAEEWKEAIAVLRTIVATDGNDADALNLLGFSLRKSGDLENAEGFYLRALELNPGHKGANEYLGELYVEIGQIEKAKERLETLARLCGNTTCEEYEDLEKAIAAGT